MPEWVSLLVGLVAVVVVGRLVLALLRRWALVLLLALLFVLVASGEAERLLSGL